MSLLAVTGPTTDSTTTTENNVPTESHPDGPPAFAKAGPKNDAGDAPDAGADLLNQVRAALVRYVILPSSEALDAVTLWIAATHAQPFWAHAARLVIRAPEKRCGKSRLLDLVEAMSWRPLITVNASPAAVYRSIGSDDPPTILLDEADTVFGPKAGDSNEELRGLLNAGHQRKRPALRYNANTATVEAIPTFAMAALAGIGQMPDTIEDRGIVVRMRRRGPGEEVAPFRHRRDAPALAVLRNELHTWIRENGPQLEDAAPAMPLEDRAADTWEPLVAVADLAGDDWPQLARAAALALTAEHDASTDAPLTVRLLTDCRAAFGTAEALPTDELLSRLKEDPEAPWATWGGRADGLTAMKLGQLLRQFDIRSAGNIRFPEPLWPGVGQAKGYLRLTFEDAWRRYCPAPPDTGPAEDGDQEGGTSEATTDTDTLDLDSEGKPSQPSQPSAPRPGPVRLYPWDGSSRPAPQAVPELTSTGTAGTAGTAPPPRPVICIACRQPMTYDDGSDRHPLCS